jgi:hypothetical protein
VLTLLGRHAGYLVDYSGETISLISRGECPSVLMKGSCAIRLLESDGRFWQDTAFKSRQRSNITVDPKSVGSYIAKMPNLRRNCLFDEDRRVSTPMSLNATSSMHRGQFPGHSYILIVKNGRISFIKDDPEMAVRNQELLKVIETL